MKNSLILFLFSLLSQTVIAQTITVAQNGSGQFTTIQAALNSLDTNTTQLRTIYIRNGTYRENS